MDATLATSVTGFQSLCSDLENALGGLVESANHDLGVWEKGRRGKWTAGQHVAHVAIILERTADLFEQAEQAMRAGTLPPPPRRDLLQRFFLRVVVHGGAMPRGAKTASWALPPDRPEREATLDAIDRDAGRHWAIGQRLEDDQRPLLWIANPFLPKWHYRLPEMVRMHAVHARHHRRLVEETVRD